MIGLLACQLVVGQFVPVVEGPRFPGHHLAAGNDDAQLDPIGLGAVQEVVFDLNWNDERGSVLKHFVPLIRQETDPEAAWVSRRQCPAFGMQYDRLRLFENWPGHQVRVAPYPHISRGSLTEVRDRKVEVVPPFGLHQNSLVHVDVGSQLRPAGFALLHEGQQNQGYANQPESGSGDPRYAEIFRPDGGRSLSLKVSVIVLSLVSGIIFFGVALRACLRRQWPTAALLIYAGTIGVGLSAIASELFVGDFAVAGLPDHPCGAADGGCGDER